MCILEKLNFKIFRGDMPPDPLVYSIQFLPDNSELLPPGLLLPMDNTQYNIMYLTYTALSVEKYAPSVLYGDIYFKDC